MKFTLTLRYSRVLDFVYDQYQAESPNVGSRISPWTLASTHEGADRAIKFWNRKSLVADA